MIDALALAFPVLLVVVDETGIDFCSLSISYRLSEAVLVLELLLTPDDLRAVGSFGYDGNTAVIL